MLAPDAAEAALQRVMDVELAAMQRCGQSALTGSSEERAWQALLAGSGRIEAVACFVADSALSRYCRHVGRYIRLADGHASQPSAVLKRLLRKVLQCRELLNRPLASEYLRQVLLVSLQQCTAAASATAPVSGEAADSPDGPATQHPVTWLRQAWPLYVDVQRASSFLPKSLPRCGLRVADRNSPPQDLTAIELLKAVLHLQSSLAQAGHASAFGTCDCRDWKQVIGLELDRHLRTYPRTANTGDEPESEEQVLAIRKFIWRAIQLSRSVRAVLVIGDKRHNKPDLIAELADAIINDCGVILHLQTEESAAAPASLKRVLKRVLLMKWTLLGEPGTKGLDPLLEPALSLAVPALSDELAHTLATLVQASQKMPSTTMIWRDLGIDCYRLLVRLRMLVGGYLNSVASQGADSPGQVGDKALDTWLVLVGSVYRCIGYCHQLPVQTAVEQQTLRFMLDAMSAWAAGHPDAAGCLRQILMLESRLALTAGRCWQAAVLELDTEQDDFNGLSVHHALASGLRLLPSMSVAPNWAAEVQPEMLNELRLLLKGARVLRIQTIESLVWVMIDACQAQQRPPVAVMRRAHRSLCRMLDQAAAWQTPGNARRMINSLYASLNEDSSRPGRHDAVREHTHGHDSRQQSLNINWRLRKILRQCHDLDSVRVLMQELLRSQEDLLATPVAYASGSDSSALGVSRLKRL